MIWWIIASIAVFFFLFVLGGTIYAYIRTYKMPKKRALLENKVIHNEELCAHIDELLTHPYEEIYVKSYDGAKIFARYYEVKKGAPIHIMMHGYRGFAEIDFSGGAKVVRELEHNILLVDMRGHGKSDGNQTCFGIKERYDALALANYVYERFGDDTPIFLNGASMGGNTALMSMGLKLPKTVVGVISDGAFSSPNGIIKYTIEKERIPKILLPYTAAYIASVLFGGFNIGASSAKEVVSRIDMPILLLHGTNDSIVPYEMAREIYEASCSKEKFLCAFEGAEHVMCYYANKEKYKNAIYDFTRLCLEKYKENNLIKEKTYEGPKGNKN